MGEIRIQLGEKMCCPWCCLMIMSNTDLDRAVTVACIRTGM